MPAPTSRTPAGAHGPGAPFDDEPHLQASPPRTVTLPRWLAACVIGTGLLTLVLASTGDAVPLLDAPDSPTLGSGPGPLELPTVTSTAATASASPSAAPQPYDIPWLRPVVLGVLAVVGVLMVTGTLVAIAVVAKRLWEDRWQPPDVQEAVADEMVTVDLAHSREAVVTAAADMRRTLRTGSPRNAVVRCWLLLVESLTRRGIEPDPAQSATEFTRYALSCITTDRAAVGELTVLFLEARFSEHDMGEEARERAVAALDRVLASLGATTPAGLLAGVDEEDPP